MRGALPGARDWTHQYADAGNTSSSDDERVRGRPEVLWYGEPGADKMHDRHRRSEAPLQIAGRMFVEGTRQSTKTPLLLSFDAYNGLPYWEREFPGAERLDITQDCGNLAVSPHGLFVVTDKACHQLDLATGATRRIFPTPAGPDGQPGVWSYVATDGDLLLGSVSAGYQFSRTLFAYDVRSGALKALAVAELKRLSVAPDIPTVAEQGIDGFEATPWFGLVTTAGTPAAVARANQLVMVDEFKQMDTMLKEAEQLAKQAHKHRGLDKLRFEVADMASEIPPRLAGAPFDAVVCPLVLSIIRTLRGSGDTTTNELVRAGE